MEKENVKKAAQAIAKELYNCPERVGNNNWSIGVHKDGSIEWNHSTYPENGGDYEYPLYGQELPLQWSDEAEGFEFEGETLTQEDVSNEVERALVLIVEEKE